MSDLLKVKNLTVRFEVKRGGGWSKKSYLYAVDDVSFNIKKAKGGSKGFPLKRKDFPLIPSKKKGFPLNFL